jgi:hypothetical protein
MAFSMPLSANARRAAAGVLALLLATAAGAEFKAFEIQPKLADNSLELAGQLELAFTPKVEEALAKGIPLEILFEISLYGERRWMWNRKIGDWKIRREIRYHALSGQYLVKFSPARAGGQESYTSLSEAMHALGNLNELRFALDELPIGADQALLVRLRVSLDIEALPTPLRPVAYTSLAWHLNSGWSQWKVAR